VIWKNSTDALQTWGEPPNVGRIIFATIGWTRKRRNDPRKIVRVKRARTAGKYRV
jgi:hypothetical protein